MLPFDIEKAREANYEWELEMQEPDSWDPHFYYSQDGHPTVVFYTVDNVHPVSINRFIHTFSKADYTMRIERAVVASGPAGIIF